MKWGGKAAWCSSPALSFQAFSFLKISLNFQQFWINSGHIAWSVPVPELQSDPRGPALGPNITTGNKCFGLAKSWFSPCDFSGPIRSKSPGLSNRPGTPVPSVGRVVAELPTLGWALLLPSLRDTSGDLELGGRLSREGEAEETEADDNHTKSSPLFPTPL